MTNTATPKPKKPRKYLNNRDLLEQFHLSIEQGAMTDKFAHMLMTLCDRYGRRGNFVSYTYNDDMRAYAMMMIVKTWHKFNPEKSSNPFAFYTQCIKNSFVQYLNQEKRQRDIRDEMLVERGLNPSFSYEEAHRSANDEESGECSTHINSDDVDSSDRSQEDVVS